MDKDILNLDEFEVISLEENENGDYLFNVKPKFSPKGCPECGSGAIVKNGTYNRFARDLNCFEHKAGIFVMGNRYQCCSCKRNFSDTFNSIEARAKITVRLKMKIRELAIKKPFLQIAEEYGITTPTVKNVFLDYVEEEEKKRVLYSPAILGIDEAHLNKKPRGVIVDVKARRVIEMLDNRTKSSVKDYFNSLPNSDKIKVVTMDMWRPYAEAVYECLPNAKIVIDRFHVVKALNKALDDVRKRCTEKTRGKGSRTDTRRLKGLLGQNYEDLKGSDAFELEDILANNENLNVAYTLKENLRNIYLCKTREEAENIFKLWAEDIPDDLTEFKSIEKMINNWHKEIFNFFDCDRYTNGVVESMNNIIKSIERYGRGYTFEVLRAKVMFSTAATKPPKYSFKKPISKRPSGPPEGAFGLVFAGRTPTYQESKESRVLEIGTGVDMDELAAILDSGEF